MAIWVFSPNVSEFNDLEVKFLPAGEKGNFALYSRELKSFFADAARKIFALTRGTLRPDTKALMYSPLRYQSTEAEYFARRKRTRDQLSLRRTVFGAFGFPV